MIRNDKDDSARPPRLFLCALQAIAQTLPRRLRILSDVRVVRAGQRMHFDPAPRQPLLAQAGVVAIVVLVH